MADIAELGLVVDSRGFVKANRDLRDFENRAGRVERVAGSMGAAVARAGAQVGAMAAAFLSIRSALQATQQVAEITNGFRAMGQSSQQAAQSLEAVAGVANRTRAPLDATANLYRRISVAAGELGASQQGVLRFTENVGLALAAAGSGGAAASGALMQLSQAMAGGVVRAEEFNSILENAFPIAQAAARGIYEAGGSVGRLRQLVVEGEISSREFFDAIIGQTAELEAAFAKTVPTIDQALTLLNNNFTMLVGQFDQTLGVSSTLAQAIIALGNGMQWLSNNSEMVFEVLGRIASVAAVLATVFVARTAVAIGTTYVQAAISAVRQTIALEMALGATSRSAAVASAGLKLFTAALRTMKGVLVTTGLGALVVLAGEAVFQFGRLVKATGSFGAALNALGNVAGLVWQGIIDSAAAIPPALNGVWSLMKAGFLGALADMADEFYQFINGIATSMGQIKAFKGVSNSLLNVAVSAGEAASNLGSASREAKAAADGAFAQAGATISEAFGPARAAVADLMQTVTASEDSMDGAAGAAGDLADAVGGSGGGGKKGGKDSASEAAKKAAAEIKKLREEAQKLNDAADPVGKFTKQLAELEKLKEYGLNARGYNKAVQELNDELASSLPLVDDLTGAFSEFLQSGLSDFKGFAESIFGSFKKLIADMAATALRNRLLIPIAAGVTGGSALGAVGQAALGAGGNPLGGLLGGGQGGGLLSGLLGTAGTAGAAGSGFLGGLSGSLSGGIGGFFNIGANAAAAGGGFGAMLGAAAGPVGLALGVASLFKSTREVVANGVRFQLEGAQAELASYEKSKKTNGLGMSSGFSRDFDRLDDSVQSAVQARVDGFIDGLGMLGLNNNLSGFQWSERTEIKDGETFEGEQEEVIRKALDRAVEYVAGGAVDAFVRSGESVSQAVERMVASLTGVNGVLEDLGHRAYQVGLQGADAASQLADLFGGIEGFTQATGYYFQTFYSEAERNAVATERATQALQEYNVALPQTREAYRALVEGADLSTKSGRELYATLLGLGSVMNDILPATEAVASTLSSVLSGLVGAANSAVAEMVEETREVAQEMRAAARDWYRAAETLRGFLNDRRIGRDSSLPIDTLFAAQRRAVDKAFGKALGGDVQGAQDFTELAQNFLATARDRSGTSAEFRVIENQILAQANKLAGVAELTGAARTVGERLAQQQLDVLQELSTYLQNADTIAPDDIQGFRERLGSLQVAIQEAEMFSYEYLKERLKVTVDVLADASIPEHMRVLLRNATDGIWSTIEFAVRAPDLTPELRWLAVNEASNHLKKVKFIAENNMPSDISRLALNEITDSTARINAVLRSENPGLKDLLSVVGEGGKVEVAGGVMFDVSDAFENSLKKNAHDPLSRVNDTLGAIQRHFEKEAALQAVERAKEEKVAALQSRLQSAVGRSTDRSNAAQSIIDQIKGLEESTGVDIRNGKGDAALRIAPDGSIIYDATHVAYGKSADIDAFRKAFWANGGLEDQLGRQQALRSNNQERIEALRAQIADLGAIPAFAMGGMHAGGLRLVGERGPELEATGPARYYSASQTQEMMGGGKASAEELRALREEISEANSRDRQLTPRMLYALEKMTDYFEQWDVDGLPAERVDA